jgi:uncharacterized membrane protein YdjX (TVP38/TMEM64 family)
MPEGETIENNLDKPGKSLKGKAIPLLTVLIVIVITVALFIFRDKVSELGNFGYLGIFLISLVGNATIVLPVPTFMLVVAFGASFNPFLVGVVSGLGGTIGEMTCYLLGFSGRGVVENRQLYDRCVRWLGKWGALTVFVFAATPSPFDVVGIVAGFLRYPFWKFFLASLGGKIIKYIVLALAGYWGWDFIERGMGPASTIILAALVTAILLAAALYFENKTWKKKS